MRESSILWKKKDDKETKNGFHESSVLVLRRKMVVEAKIIQMYVENMRRK